MDTKLIVPISKLKTKTKTKKLKLTEFGIS